MKGRPTRRFRARLVSRGPRGAWTLLVLPFSVQKVWGTRARVPVCGTMNGKKFRSSAMPRGDGRHVMVVCRELRDRAKAEAGDTVRVVMGVDERTRYVRTPPALARALAKNSAAAARYDAKSYSWKKEHVDYLQDARQEATKARRLRLILRALRGA